MIWINLWINILEDKSVDVTMTLTAPNCPAAESLPVDVKNKIEGNSWNFQSQDQSDMGTCLDT
jgi:metal-sulfur cluster biosynthetic enzyme